MRFWLRDVRSLPYAHCCGVQMLSDRSYVIAMSSTTYMGRPMSEATQLSQQANFYWLTPLKGFLKAAPEVTRKHTLQIPPCSYWGCSLSPQFLLFYHHYSYCFSSCRATSSVTCWDFMAAALSPDQLAVVHGLQKIRGRCSLSFH